MKVVLRLVICALIPVTALMPVKVFSQGSGDKFIVPGSDEKIDAIQVEISGEAAFHVGGMKVTLGKAIEMVLEQNRDTLSGAYDVAMTDSAYRRYLNKYSPTLNVEGGMSYQKYPDEMGIIVPEDEKSISASASLMKSFSTGTTISGGVAHEYTRSTLKTIPGMPFSLGDPEYHRPVLFAGIRQELLKNSFGYNERRQREILKNVGKMQKDAIIFQLSGLVVSVVVDYWTMVISNTELFNAELQLKETRRVRNIIAENVRLGLAESFDLNYYNTLVAGAEAAMTSAKQKFRDSARSLLTTLNLDESISLAGAAILTDGLPEINLSESLKTAYERRADYNNALIMVENARKELEVFSNQALPSLTAEVNVSSMGQSGNMPPAYRQSSSADYPGFEARLRMTYPLNDLDQKTNERDARFRLEQAKLQLDKHKRTVRDDVVSRSEHIAASHEMYLKAKEARVQSELYYRRLLANLRRGRFTAAVVKNGLDAMVMSRQRELEALVGFNINLLQFDIARNTLFERFNIDVEKYIPR